MHTYLFIHKSFPYLCVCVCACVCLIETEVWVAEILLRLCGQSLKSYQIIRHHGYWHNYSLHNHIQCFPRGLRLIQFTQWMMLTQQAVIQHFDLALLFQAWNTLYHLHAIPIPKNNWENSSFIFQWAPNTISTFFFFFFFGIMLGSPTLHG